MSIRKITFGGNLTADPELRQIGENTVCNFSVSCNDYQGGRKLRILSTARHGAKSASPLQIISKRAAESL